MLKYGYQENYVSRFPVYKPFMKYQQGGLIYKGFYPEEPKYKHEELNYHDFDVFTTTLSISPHKNADWINEIGEELSDKYGVRFLNSDFKKKEGYKRSIELSRKYDLYRQNYCGCVYSDWRDK